MDKVKKRYLIICLSMLIMFNGLIAIQLLIDINLHLLACIVGFINLSFVPGFLILKIMNTKFTDIFNKIVYSLGLSIFLLMFIFLTFNFSMPYFGIEKPITLIPMLIGFDLIVLLLCYLAFKFNVINDVNFKFSYATLINPVTLYLILILLLFIIFGLVLPILDDKIIKVALFIGLLTIPFVIKKEIMRNKISIAIYGLYVVAIALMFQVTLVSSTLPRLNVDNEYYFINNVISNGIWESVVNNPQIPLGHHNINTALSVVMLAPVYVNLLSIDIEWVMKLIYPVIYAFIPIILFQIYKKEFNISIALLAAVFFIFSASFTGIGLMLRRQIIGNLYFVLLLLVMVETELNNIQKKILALVFLCSMAVSHYATGYIVMIYFILSFILIYFLNGRIFKKFVFFIQGVLNVKIWDFNYWSDILKSRKLLLTVQYIVFAIVFSLSWYIYNSQSSTFITLVEIAKYSFNHISQFLDLNQKHPLVASQFGSDLFNLETLAIIYRLINYLIQLLIVIGIVKTLTGSITIKHEYLLISIVSFISLIMAIIIPGISVALYIDRIHYYCLLTLSPFFIIGCDVFSLYLYKLNNKFKFLGLALQKSIISNIALFIIIPYFLFNIGLIFNIAGYENEDTSNAHIPYSYSLSYNDIDTIYVNNQEINAARWVGEHANVENGIYCDLRYASDLLTAWYKGKINGFPENAYSMSNNSLIYLRNWNVVNNEVIVMQGVRSYNNGVYYNINDTTYYINFKLRNKIYSTENCNVLG